jgi:hypothetical protein
MENTKTNIMLKNKPYNIKGYTDNTLKILEEIPNLGLEERENLTLDVDVDALEEGGVLTLEDLKKDKTKPTKLPSI